MSENATELELNMTECPRDQGVETNLRCGQCGDPICPRCMVYAPVGSKCPDCASIGGPVMFKVSQNDLIRIGIVAGLAALGIGIASAVTLVALWSLDILAGVNSSIWLIVVGVAEFLGVMGVTYVMQLVAGTKYSTSLRIMAAGLALLFYVTQVMAIEIMAGMFTELLIGPGIVVHLPGLIGFGFGTYYAMQRFKP